MTDSLLVILICIQLWIAIRQEKLLRRLSALFLLMPSAASAQQRAFVGPMPQVKIEKLWTPSDAQSNALADLMTLPAEARPRIRYIWLREPSAEGIKSLTVTLNRISRAQRIFRPTVLADFRLARLDLAFLTFDVEKELEEMAEIYENLRFDPAFNLLLTPDALKVILSLPTTQQPIATVRSGNVFSLKPLSTLAEADVVRLNAGHLDAKTTIELQATTVSAAPVVSKEYFEFRVSNSIKDKGPFSTIFGGLYYDFKGIPKSAKKGRSDLDALLESLGASGKRVAEQRVGMFQSGVTGKPRAIDFVPATNLRVGDGQSFVVITSDVKDASIDATQHAIQTLRKQIFKPDGHEVIFSANNGMQGYALYDGQGTRVDEAPPDLVMDTTIPAQFSKRLQSCSSCIRCHEADAASNGLKPVANDVQTLLDRGLDIYGDLTEPNKSILRTVQETAALYKGTPDKFLRQARWQFQSAVTDAVGQWEKAKPTDIVRMAARRWETDSNSHWYGRVDAQVALRELGFGVIPKQAALPMLRQLLKPDQDAKVAGVTFEDVRIGALMLDMSIGRIEWSLVQAFAQGRASKQIKQLRDNKP